MSISAARTPWPRDPRYLVGEDGSIVGPRGQPLTPFTYGRGYLGVQAGGRLEYVHIIVCETFHGPRPPGKQVAHENGVRSDCRSENLSWKTPKDNQADRRRHGTYTCGEVHSVARLTEVQARAILAACASGRSQRLVAAEFGTTQGNVSLIVRGVTWGHIR